MIDSLSYVDVVEGLRRMADDVTAQADLLRELDAAIGDGDLGITVTIGFEAVVEGLPTADDTVASGDIAGTILKAGMAFNRKAASTFGALFATMLMRAARVAKGKSEIDLATLAEMFAAAADGVRERGKSQVGDKTLLDALVPAAQALVEAAAEGATLATGLQHAAAAADDGARATVAMKSKIGRASWFADRTEGVQDPGATAVSLMIHSLASFVLG